ncbi:retrovirus-related pol polyprotein from transposon TNT 1-94 [Tanacetum coccineum]
MIMYFSGTSLQVIALQFSAFTTSGSFQFLCYQFLHLVSELRSIKVGITAIGTSLIKEVGVVKRKRMAFVPKEGGSMSSSGHDLDELSVRELESLRMKEGETVDDSVSKLNGAYEKRIKGNEKMEDIGLLLASQEKSQVVSIMAMDVQIKIALDVIGEEDMGPGGVEMVLVRKKGSKYGFSKLAHLAVNHIVNSIPVLEMETDQYTSWAELFRIHCRAYDVIDHLTSNTPPPPKDKEPAMTPETWSRLDAIKAWDRLKDIFQDTKHLRVLSLEHLFSNTQLDNFSNISSYCQELKMLVDQLANVSTPVSNQRLVLQLIAILNESYDGVATIIQQSDPLPTFYDARSKLILEETRKNRQANIAGMSTGTALITSNDTRDTKSSTNSTRDTSRSNNFQANRGRGGGRNGGRGCNGGRGRGRGGALWTRPPGPSGSAGILRPRPQQAYATSVAPSTPTNIESALHTMTLNPPDEIWYMDTGASIHMTASPGLATPSGLILMPSPRYMAALKRILRYIQGTLQFGLHLTKSSTNSLVSYTDANWAGCPDTARSTSGYCVYLGDTLVSWSSKRQPTLSRSNAEAEYRGVANVVYTSCWLCN